MSAQERKKTLGKQFRTQLDELLKTLYKTQPHYIRCIKPNDLKQPKTFISQMCYEQLTFSGVFEAVQVSGLLTMRLFQPLLQRISHMVWGDRFERTAFHFVSVTMTSSSDMVSYILTVLLSINVLVDAKVVRL